MTRNHSIAIATYVHCIERDPIVNSILKYCRNILTN